MDTREAFYVGKNIDTFEHVLNAFMCDCKCSTVDYADCISLRCFAFNFSGSIKEWFSPLVCDDIAVENLSSCMVEGTLKIYCAEDFRPDEHESFMLSCRRPLFIQECLREEFYLGAKYYAECRNEGNFFVINDMTQNYYDYVEVSCLEKWLHSEGEYALCIEGRPKFLRPPYSEVIKNAYAIRLSCPSVIEPQKINRYDKIALLYGLMNYQIQTSKAINYLSSEANIPPVLYETWKNISDFSEWPNNVRRFEECFTDVIRSLT